MSQDDEEDIPLGLTKEQWADMLAEVKKRDAISRKRTATQRANAEAREAERLSKPPVDLDDAWQRHAAACPHPAFSDASKAWFRENSTFEFEGTLWRRERRFQTTNSGKSQRLRSIKYYGADGRVVTTFDDGPNRRNDPARDWGLPD